MDSKDNAIYMALKNPNQVTSIIDGNGTKIWLDPYGFISALNKSIKWHKKHLAGGHHICHKQSNKLSNCIDTKNQKIEIERK